LALFIDSLDVLRNVPSERGSQILESYERFFLRSNAEERLAEGELVRSDIGAKEND
jgi:hypothetical protein